ncbi:centriolar and ciliogenesis-associated protein HYLS1 [Engraulis encrasicolus]|uniref:centriolar and ciliogenesis-associated protein HYLS1 n=1 Tax=Engraulis encrasicolus TaxID=184585 RepID=UPI002FD318F5
MDLLDFSEAEIEEQLSALGYNNIPKQRLQEFKKDLDALIRQERSKSQSPSDWSSTRSRGDDSRSPPAFTKEKVQLNAPELNNVFTQPPPERRQRQILTSTFTEGQHSFDMPSRGHVDSYAQYSVMPKYTRPATAPCTRQMPPAELELEPEPEPSQSSNTFSDTSPERDTDTRPRGKPSIKRKVLRKHRGEPRVFDESTHSEDSGAVSGLEECLDRLQMSDMHRRHRGMQLESEEMESLSSDGELPSAYRHYFKGMVRSHSENDIRPRPKSVIIPMDHPHTRNLKKTDPVSKYFQYKEEWDAFKAPGEKDHRALRLEIREQLAYQPLPLRPRKALIPNTYVVPTDKRRDALRWEIRHDLAHGIIPTKMAFR